MTQACDAARARQSACGQYSLRELFERIADAGDIRALHEFHDNRRPFQLHGERLRCGEYIAALCQNLPDNGADIAYETYSLTLQKFLNLPGGEDAGENRPFVKYRGVNARKYYRGLVTLLARQDQAQPKLSRIERELADARITQRYVKRHVQLSHRESARITPFTSRYRWRINGKALVVWMPRTLSGKARGEWLSENITDVDPSRPGERQRLQAIVDARLARGGFRALDVDKLRSSPAKELTPQWAALRDIRKKDLAAHVAQEKIENIDRQRGVIRALGPATLWLMIVHIFTEIDCGEYVAARTARQFGLSPASFCRFAGMRWKGKAEGDPDFHIPDLWRNTAHVLVNDIPEFQEIAKKAGVWETVETINERSPSRGSRERPKNGR